MAGQRKGFGVLGWVSLLLLGGGGFVFFLGYQESSTSGFSDWVMIGSPLVGLGVIGLALAVARAIDVRAAAVIVIGAGVGGYAMYDHYVVWKAQDDARHARNEANRKLERKMADFCRVPRTEGPDQKFTRVTEGGIEGHKALPAELKPPLKAAFFMTTEFSSTKLEYKKPWANWRPKDLKDVDLVGCFGWLETKLGSCAYDVGTVWRSIQRRNVRLFDPATGKLVHEIDVAGSKPGPCPATKKFSSYGGGEYSSGSIVGDKYPDKKEVVRQLEAFLGPKSAK